MGKTWKSPRAPDTSRAPTTIHEIARRYHACAVALAQTLGLAVAEVLREHRESVTAIFIECGRCDLRLPASVKLPPLVALVNGQGHGSQGTPAIRQTEPGHPHGTGDPEPPQARDEVSGDTPLPTTIPADGDLPCRGQEIATLKPGALAMLRAKVAALVHAEGAGWAPFLAALQAERTRRLAQGPRRR
jgi:hypothetical protein